MSISTSTTNTNSPDELRGHVIKSYVVLKEGICIIIALRLVWNNFSNQQWLFVTVQHALNKAGYSRFVIPNKTN